MIRPFTKLFASTRAVSRHSQVQASRLWKGRLSRSFSDQTYWDDYAKSVNSPQDFWFEQTQNINWFKNPTLENSLKKDENGVPRWFVDGQLNTSYLCLDKHCEDGFGNDTALVWDSPVTSTVKEISYSELLNHVSKFAGALKNIGVSKGDRVIIYMPMIWQAAVAMLACARLGAIHCVVFGGFAPKELAVRIDDLQPKVLITADYGIEVNKIIPYKSLVDQSLEIASHPPEKTVIYHRSERQDVPCLINPAQDMIWDELMNEADAVEAVPVKSTDPLYVMYTSGTTGHPKGIVRDNGGHAVALKWSMSNIFGVDPGDTMFTASDIGWVVGHSYIIYGPLINRTKCIMFEGKPVKTPDAGTFWRIMSDYKAKSFFTAPTAIRAIKQEDPQGDFLQKYDLSHLKYLYLAGERLDPATQKWLEELLPGKMVMDNWWQTETGWPIVANPAGRFPVKKGSPTVPMPGYNIQVLDEEGMQKKPGETGNLAIKLPLPPGNFPTIWRNHSMYEQHYMQSYPGYYLTGDGGYIDEDGYCFIMGRTDDVINIAGHRLSTGQLEELVANHASVAECAVIGVTDKLKGEIPIGFVVLKDGARVKGKDLEAEVVKDVRKAVGPIAFFKTVIEVQRLPKTKSGKILRSTMRKLTETERDSVPNPPTIDDPNILTEIANAMKCRKIGPFYA